MNPKAYIVAEKRCISDDQVSCAKAITILMMVYFVFKFSYGPKAAPVLHFLQRQDPLFKVLCFIDWFKNELHCYF